LRRERQDRDVPPFSDPVAISVSLPALSSSRPSSTLLLSCSFVVEGSLGLRAIVSAAEGSTREVEGEDPEKKYLRTRAEGGKEGRKDGARENEERRTDQYELDGGENEHEGEANLLAVCMRDLEDLRKV